MSLKGIDISNWQAGINLAAVNFDFAIIKATEGVNYVSPSCDAQFQAVKAKGKLRGVYHFARNTKNSAEDEANFFVNNIKGYLDKKTVLVLDWEDVNTSDVAWAKRWLDKVQQLTGVKPIIYMSESVVNSHDWSSVANADYGLWVAKYRDYAADYNYDMSLAGTPPSVKWWKFYTMWQWTSSGRLDGYNGNLDLNEFYGDAAAWLAYAGSKGATAPTPAPNPTPKPTPAPAGKTYTVQSGDTLSGIGAKTGVDWTSIAAINGIKSPYVIYPNQVLKLDGAVAQGRTYTVRRGDTLSGIAAVYGTTYQKLQAYNGIPDANKIFTGQVIRIP